MESRKFFSSCFFTSLGTVPSSFSFPVLINSSRVSPVVFSHLLHIASATSLADALKVTSYFFVISSSAFASAFLFASLASMPSSIYSCFNLSLISFLMAFISSSVIFLSPSAYTLTSPLEPFALFSNI